MHDGRAATLLEAVSLHEGEAAGTRDRFLNLSHRDRAAIIKFMETLVAPTDVPKAKPCTDSLISWLPLPRNSEDQPTRYSPVGFWGKLRVLGILNLLFQGQDNC